VTSGKWQVVNGNFVDLLAAEAFQEECSEGLRLATSPVFSASRELAGSFRHLSRTPFKPGHIAFFGAETKQLCPRIDLEQLAF
jgi:hypothetical protein